MACTLKFDGIIMGLPRLLDQTAIPGGDPIDIIRELAQRLIWELRPLLDWAIRNWALTLVLVVILIYWAGRQRRPRNYR